VVAIQVTLPANCREGDASQVNATSAVGGTPRWMAYELVAPSDGEGGCPMQVTTATDVWAFGTTVLEAR
jgi:hypothetical protein